MKRLHRFFLAVMFFLPLPACAATVSSQALEGKVLEEGTNKPIVNAMVTVRWIGDIGGIGHGSSVCFHVETATADDQGQFRIPAWKKPSPYGDIAHQHFARDAHAPGYAFVRVDKEVIYLKPFAGGREERLKVIRTAGVSCGSAGESQKNLLPLYRTLYEEARTLAVTKEDKTIVNNFLYKIDLIELPYEEVLKRVDERNKALRKEFPQ